MIVKGKTKSGIKFQLDDRIKDDARFLFYLAKAQDKEADMSVKNDAVMGILTLIFGKNENVIEFMNAVALKHDGFCSTEVMLNELAEMFEALNVKN